MLLSSVWILLAGLSTTVVAAPSAKHALKLKESITAPRGWTRRDEAPHTLLIELRIALPQPRFAQLEEHLYAVRSVSDQCSSWRISHGLVAIPVMNAMVPISPMKKLTNSSLPTLKALTR